jgi:hypothetical protein
MAGFIITEDIYDFIARIKFIKLYLLQEHLELQLLLYNYVLNLVLNFEVISEFPRYTRKTSKLRALVR